MPMVEPFLRWAGGKNWLIPHLSKIIGENKIEHYHEPFLGGGAIFFCLDHEKKSYLSDTNDDLVQTYIQVRDNPQGVINCFNKLKNTKNDYYTIRDNYVDLSPEEAAARFIYLNQTSYNGLYRVNKEGHYNVPYGNRSRLKYDTNRILAASKKLSNSRITTGDFEINKYKIKENDLVFLDPPYTVSHNNNGFIAYNQHLFSIEDQKRLKKFIEFIKRKNAYYILTNAAHETIRKIFLSDGDRLIILERNSLIGGKNSKRKAIKEFIFTNIPEENHE